MAATLIRSFSKRTTGLVGLAVNPQARGALVELYQKTLVSLAEIPESAEYRQATEKLTRHRLAVVSAESDRETIERQINCGQLEELIVQAEEELKLAAKMKEWKAWEPLAVTPPPNQWDRA